MKRTAAEAAETRAAVVEAALWVFAEKGWDATRLEDVAQRAGVTRGAVYHHSRGKADLLTRVLTEHWRPAVAPALAWLGDTDADGQRRVTGFLAEYLRMLDEDARFRALVVVTVEVAPHLPSDAGGVADKRDALDAWAEGLHTAFTEIGDPLPSGLSADEAVHSVMAVIYGATSLTSLRTRASPVRRPTAVASALVHGLVHGEAQP